MSTRWTNIGKTNEINANRMGTHGNSSKPKFNGVNDAYRPCGMLGAVE